MIYLYLWLTLHGTPQWVQSPDPMSIEKCGDWITTFPGLAACDSYPNNPPKWSPHNR